MGSAPPYGKDDVEASCHQRDKESLSGTSGREEAELPPTKGEKENDRCDATPEDRAGMILARSQRTPEV